jgi:hypothetical protein
MRVLSWLFKANSNWQIALALTCAFGIAGLFCIAILIIFPSSIVAAPGWPIVDKRWLVALYGLGVGLVYFPLVVKEIANLLTRSELTATTGADEAKFARAEDFTSGHHHMGTCRMGMACGTASSTNLAKLQVQ